jgi:hypothetical protein
VVDETAQVQLKDKMPSGLSTASPKTKLSVVGSGNIRREKNEDH